MRNADDTTRQSRGHEPSLDAHRQASSRNDAHTDHAQPHLRLVHDASTPRMMSTSGDARARSDRLREAKARQFAQQHWEAAAQVTTENQAAASLSAFDARWVMAVRVASSLEGGRAAVLTPERRARLISTAEHLGLRRFDANLIMAMVQDAARRGQPPLGQATAEQLVLIAPPKHHAPEQPSRLTAAWLLLGSAVLAIAWAWMIIRWLLG